MTVSDTITPNGSTDTMVRFELPEYVRITEEAFDGQNVTITYDSNFGGDVTVEGMAELDEGRYPSDPTTLVVDDRAVRGNEHVFHPDSGRHLGKVESATVTAPHDVAVDLITKHTEYDVDRDNDRTVVQTWDNAIMEREGFMAGTDSHTLEHIEVA